MNVQNNSSTVSKATLKIIEYNHFILRMYYDQSF